jgi:hypothetical protein
MSVPKQGLKDNLLYCILMENPLLRWDIYDVKSATDALIGVSMRGRIRKFAVESTLNLLVDNAGDTENCVRFAMLVGEDTVAVRGFIKQIVPDVTIELSLPNVANPVLSKLSVNNEAKYSLD